MNRSFIDSPPSFNPLLSESDNKENSDNEDDAAPSSKRPKRYNAEARRKVEEYLEMKRLEKLTQEFSFDKN